MSDLIQDSLHYTASVMGNPEYLKAVSGITVSQDRRYDGLEKLNSFHKSHHDERTKRDADDKKKKDQPA